MAETALGSLARLLLTAPEQAIHFGSGNLSLYRDVATMDPHPGFLNGVLSLLLNNSDPPDRYAMEEQNAAPYFRRARAAELVALFESRFPNSPERADLRERVIEATRSTDRRDGVIRAGTKFLADFPNAPNRTAVALRMADAYARTNQTQQEFAIYDALLAELAKRAERSSVGAMPLRLRAWRKVAPRQQFDPLRSPEYARVLDRYVARLVSLKRVPRCAGALPARDRSQSERSGAVRHAGGVSRTEQPGRGNRAGVSARHRAVSGSYLGAQAGALVSAAEAAGRCGAADARCGQDFFGHGAGRVFPRDRASGARRWARRCICN